MTSPFLGEIRMFGFNFAPRGWAFCNGQTLSISQNAALFSLLGTTYGGNGVQTFQLPNLQSRVAMSFGTSLSGNTVVQGQTAGTESVTLTTTEIPAHNHSVNATTVTGDKRPADTHLFATGATAAAQNYRTPTTPVALTPQSLSQSGQSLPHSNLQPYLVTNYCIALQGIYPSRS